jgi:dTDP-4-amino-4,6-dideoxygalactose transaminase
LEDCKTLADKYNLWIIEDACHRRGIFQRQIGQKQFCGNGHYADLAIFSFHPVKHIACGEGGRYQQIMRRYKSTLATYAWNHQGRCLMQNHGGWYYEMQELGFNYRLTDFQAALGTSS